MKSITSILNFNIYVLKKFLKEIINKSKKKEKMVLLKKKLKQLLSDSTANGLPNVLKRDGYLNKIFWNLRNLTLWLAQNLNLEFEIF